MNPIFPMTITAVRSSAMPWINSSWMKTACFAFISVVYFVDMSLRASRKLFWADELFTFYLCRLPSFRDTWAAVIHGVDFNPPLFYLLTRGAQHVFGDGLIATRLPAILAFWIFCVCLFLFTKRRTDEFCGLIAASLPFFTIAHYYAYEARPHGIVLGWCGLALICWQKSFDGGARQFWNIAFGLSLLGGLLTHVYAVYMIVPFGLVELYEFFTTRKWNWGRTTPVALAVAFVVPAYLPLFRTFRALRSLIGIPGGPSGGPQSVFAHFFLDVTGPSVLVLFIAVALIARQQVTHPRTGFAVANIPEREWVLAVAFGFIPVVAYLGVKISHGPFFERYFLSCIAGYSILLGFAMYRVHGRKWASGTLAAAMLLLVVGDLAIAVRHALQHNIFDLTEPVSQYPLNASPSEPLVNDSAVLSSHADLDVLVVNQLKYIYLVHYAPPDLAAHLYYAGRDDNDFFLLGYRQLATWAHLDLKTTTFQDYFVHHKRFFVYASSHFGSACGQCIDDFLSAGYTLKSAQPDPEGILYEYAK